MPASFSPRGFTCSVLKVGICAIAIATLYLSISRDPRPFWLAYLTHWSLLVSIAYLLLSCFNTAVPFEQPATSTSPVGFRLILTWVLFEVAGHAQVLITVLYWSMVYEGNAIGTVNILVHGGLMVLVLVEGLWINRIPVRIAHFWFVFCFDALYLVWSALHSIVFDIGNPDEMDNDPDTNDDAIYSVLDWSNNPERTRTLAALVVGALGPLVFLFIWMLSIYSLFCNCSGSNRRLFSSSTAEEDEKKFHRIDI